uniref:LNS2 domain-containing protein n=1 Tax=Anisakis simplex TaxID=6269 RepID=A0A0M3J584_ANISI
LTVRDGCAIQKVLWSSFDYMNGPELCFVWEPEVSTSRASPATLAADLGLGSGMGLTPASRSGNNSETASKDSKEDTSTSMTSSVSKAPSTNNYEEIDDVFNEELLTCAIAELDVCSVCSRMHSGVLCDSMITPSTISRNDSLNCGRIEAGGDSRLERNVHYLDEFMRSSDTSGGATKSETTLDGEEQDERAMGNSEEDGEGRRSRLMASFASASSELEESQSTATEELQEVARNEFFPNTPQDLSMLLRGGQGADGCETGVTPLEGGYIQGGAQLTGYESYLEGGGRGLGTFEANMHKSDSVHTQASSFSNVSEDGEGESENIIGNQEKPTEKTLKSVRNEDAEKRNGAEGEGDEPQQQG